MRALDEVTVISEEDKGLLREVKAIVQRFQPAAEVLLYGSVARGTKGPDSDYDVLVLTDEPLAYTEQEPMQDAIYDLEMERSVLICAVFRARNQWDSPRMKLLPLYEEVERDAVAL